MNWIGPRTQAKYPAPEPQAALLVYPVLGLIWTPSFTGTKVASYPQAYQRNVMVLCVENNFENG